MFKTSVIVKLSVEGIHRWEQAKEIFPEVSFLSDYHRHMFTFKVTMAVTHSDRDVEFIMFKRDITDFLHKTYYNENMRCHFFDGKSCEMLCDEIMSVFKASAVEVWEDDENGAIVVRQ